MIEVRIHGRGGQGVKKASMILGRAAYIAGYKTQDFLIVDGGLLIPNFSLKQKAIINGDSLVFSIAAASIIAKVVRDKIMREMHVIYPDYGFDKHKGYGTAWHLQNLKKYGPCPIHRKSFGPVKSALKNEAKKSLNNFFGFAILNLRNSQSVGKQ